MRYWMLIGTRPEAIKLCPLILALRRHGAYVKVILTGQHRDMVRPVLDFFGVCPDADLAVMHKGQTLLSLTKRLLETVSEALAAESVCPDAVLVHGDTTTALVGAMCAFYAHIPVCHIEAGLRSGDIAAPFPEEWNRRVIDAAATLHFAPTAAAAAHLIAEGMCAERIFTVGNTATDALRLCLRDSFEHPILQAAAGRRLVILTTHRRELSDATRATLLQSIRARLTEREDVFTVVPVHPSARVGEVVRANLEGCENIVLTPPLDLPVLQNLMARATLLLTDSGGMQEEATYLGLPTLVLRETTERPEGVAVGVLRCVGTEGQAVGEALDRLLEHEDERRRMMQKSTVYGDGYASERIAAVMEAWGERGVEI